jgi:tetratricopeptide (TPR) repeat protein
MNAILRIVTLASISLASAGHFVHADEIDDCVRKFTDEQLLATAQQDNKRVIALSTEGLRECGERAIFYFNMTMPLISLGREQEAQEALQNCLDLEALHVGCLKNLGNLYSSQGRYADAITQYEKILEVNPQDDDAMDNVAVVRIREGKFADAIATAHRAVGARPSNIHARITLARAYLADEQWRKAIDAIDDAAYINPHFPGLRQAISQVLVTAREAVRREAGKAKNDTWAQYYLARVTETVEEERKILRKVMRLDSGQPRILNRYAYVLEADKLQESLEVLDKCLTIDTAYWPCTMLKGDRLRRAGRSEEARVVFETGQLTAPYVPSFYWYLGLLFASQGELERAIEQLERGFELGESPTFRGLAAELHKDSGNRDSAISHASRGAMAGNMKCRELLAELQDISHQD